MGPTFLELGVIFDEDGQVVMELPKAAPDRTMQDLGAAFPEPHAVVAAGLRASPGELGLSLADRVCLSLAAFREAPVLTADRALARADVGVEVLLIR